MAAIEPVMPGDGLIHPGASAPSQRSTSADTMVNPTVMGEAGPVSPTGQTAVVDRRGDAPGAAESTPQGRELAREVHTTTFVRFSARGRRLGGLAVVVLGVWGAIVPMAGPYIGLTPYGSASPSISTPLLVLSVLPGVVAIIAGVVLAGGAARARATGTLASILAAVAGIWFVVGRAAWPMVRAIFGASGVSSGTNGALPNLLGAFMGVGLLVVLAAGIALASSIRPHRRVIETDTEEI